MLIRQLACFLLMIFGLIADVSGYQNESGDTSGQDYLSKLRLAGKKEIANSIDKFEAGRISMKQEQVLKEIRQTSQEAKLNLNKGLDTIGIRNFLLSTWKDISTTEQGIIVNAETIQTQRNLAVSNNIFHELLYHTNRRLKLLEANIQLYTGYISRIDSLSADSVLYTFPYDSVATMKYLQRVYVAARELGPIDTALRKKTEQLRQLQVEVDLLVFTLNSRIDEVEKIRKRLEASTFRKEYPFLWEQGIAHHNSGNIFTISWLKEKLALKFYFSQHRWRIVFLLGLVLTVRLFLHSLKQKVREDNVEYSNHFGEMVLRKSVVASIIIVLSIFQFIFFRHPYIFGFCIWLITSVSLLALLSGYITEFWRRFWIIVIMLFFMAGINNLVLEVSRAERWVTLFLAFAGAGYGMYILRHKNRSDLRDRNILYFVGFMVVFEIASVILNVTGRYNLSKTSMVIGYTGVVIAIHFLWTVRMLNEVLRMVSVVYKHPDRKLFYIDFDRVGDRIPGIFYVFLVFGWFILVSRNFYGFSRFSEPLTQFLDAERTIGNYTFTINSLFLFLLIIFISTVISQVISFFAGEPGDQRAKDKVARTAGIGSWLLLIRIFVLALGVFLAFAATGLPLDKLAIVLGALGVGIGLGLQGLVSNLVSGLIIAFEKPVNVGDIIEVNDRLGTMQSIGFRSSVVKLVDGACLIVPNGELLNNQLLNWTMGKNKRRLNVVVSVAYGTNLKKAKEILETLLRNHDKVLKFPDPIVSAKEFQASGVAIDLYFWIANIKEYLIIKSEIVSLVHETLGKEGIVIPFPQQDIHIIDNHRNSDSPSLFGGLQKESKESQNKSSNI